MLESLPTCTYQSSLYQTVSLVLATIYLQKIIQYSQPVALSTWLSFYTMSCKYVTIGRKKKNYCKSTCEIGSFTWARLNNSTVTMLWMLWVNHFLGILCKNAYLYMIIFLTDCSFFLMEYYRTLLDEVEEAPIIRKGGFQYLSRAIHTKMHHFVVLRSSVIDYHWRIKNFFHQQHQP